MSYLTKVDKVNQLSQCQVSLLELFVPLSFVSNDIDRLDLRISSKLSQSETKPEKVQSLLLST